MSSEAARVCGDPVTRPPTSSVRRSRNASARPLVSASPAIRAGDRVLGSDRRTGAHDPDREHEARANSHFFLFFVGPVQHERQRRRRLLPDLRAHEKALAVGRRRRSRTCRWRRRAHGGGPGRGASRPRPRTADPFSRPTDHELAVGSEVVELLAVPPPSGLSPAGGGDSPAAPRTGKGGRRGSPNRPVSFET